MDPVGKVVKLVRVSSITRLIEEDRAERELIKPLKRTSTAWISTVRTKKARAVLAEVDACPECEAFVKIMVAETGIEKSKLLKDCSRHRSEHPRPSTPPGYWDVGFK